MKFAVCNELFQDWALERGFALAAECGYEGVEIAPFTIQPDIRSISAKRRAEVRRQAKAAGVRVAGLHWLLAKTEGLYVTTPDADIRRRTADYFGKLARLCADLGGAVLVFGSPGQRNLLPGVTRREATAYAADTLGRALPVLEETGVVLALEPLGPEWGDFLRNAAEGAALVEMIGSPQVLLHLDAKAMTSDTAPPAELIRRHRDLLVHVHANDPNGQGPGFGTLDFVPIFQALGEIGYGGWVSVEVFDYSPGAERLARESIDYMRTCLDQLA